MPAEPSETAEPPAERFAIVTFAAERVVAAEAMMMDVGRAIVQERVELLVVDPKEVLAGDAPWHGISRAVLLETEGAVRLSLRRLAERAGPYRQAPYDRFVDKEALLAELSREGFEQLGGRIRAAADPDAVPNDRLAGAAETYIASGQERPALFRLMFSREWVALSRHERVQQATSAALTEPSAIVVAMAPATDTHEVSLAAWSLVHGYTSLCIEIDLEGREQRGQRAHLFAHAVEALTRLPAA